MIDLLSFFFCDFAGHDSAVACIDAIHADPEGKPLSRGSIQKLQIHPRHCLRGYFSTLVVLIPSSPVEICPSSVLVSPEPALLQWSGEIIPS